MSNISLPKKGDRIEQKWRLIVDGGKWDNKRKEGEKR